MDKDECVLDLEQVKCCYDDCDKYGSKILFKSDLRYCWVHAHSIVAEMRERQDDFNRFYWARKRKIQKDDKVANN